MLVSKEQAESNMQALAENSYPGRGIVLGTNVTGDKHIQIYWVMGRSYHSKNRVLVMNGDEVKTQPFESSDVQDPTLSYTAMRSVGDFHFIGNGSQIDNLTKSALLSTGKIDENPEGLFINALVGLSHEFDSPNYTPRLTGMTYQRKDRAMYKAMLSKIYRNGPSSTEDEPSLFTPYYYPGGFRPGEGRLIHTYNGEGSPLPTFDRDPYLVLLGDSIDEIAETYWGLLNPANKVGISVKTIDVSTLKIDHRIINSLK